VRVAETSPTGAEIATEYWDLRLAFWRSFAGALGLRSIALLMFTSRLPDRSLGHAVGDVLFGVCLFVAWAGLLPRAAALVLTILAAIAGLGGPFVAASQRDALLLGAVPLDLLAFVFARRAVRVAKPYKIARRRARRFRKAVRIRAGGGM
jgi:hypothetical protein